MFEFHGWATIRASAGCDDSPDEPAAGAVRKLISGLGERRNRAVDLALANGAFQLTMRGFHNHCDPGIVDFYGSVARAAPGSYGVLYVRDDEVAEVQARNYWVCWVMRRGVIEARRDEFLSPHIGTVEDDCSEAL